MPFAAGIFQIAVMWLLPPVLWIVLTRRLQVSWRYVALGAATWVCAMPLLLAAVVGAAVMFPNSQLAMVVALSLAAGVFEETSRYLFYRASRVLRDPASWNVAVVAGAAHGGIESIVLGVQALLGLIVFFWYPQFLPAEMRELEPTVWFFLQGAISRVMILVVHIGLTLLVWRAVARRQPLWYLSAVLIHIALDLILFGQPILLPDQQWLGWLTLVAALAGALWLIWASRPVPKAVEPTPVEPAGV